MDFRRVGRRFSIAISGTFKGSGVAVHFQFRALSAPFERHPPLRIRCSVTPHFWRASELESCAPGLPLFRGEPAQDLIRAVVIVAVQPALFHPADLGGRQTRLSR